MCIRWTEDLIIWQTKEKAVERVELGWKKRGKGGGRSVKNQNIVCIYFCQQRSQRKLIRCFLDPVPRTHVIRGRPCCSQAQPPQGPLSKYLNTLFVLQNFAKALFLFSFGTIVSPRRKWKHCLCKILEDNQRVLW